jgi:large conductance mechanosensitive channel
VTGRDNSERIGERNMKGFKNFLMRGDVIVVAVGLVVALAFSMLITAFTTDIINPLIQSLEPGKAGLGVQIRSGNPNTIVNFGLFISAIIYFVIFIAVVYFLIAVPYKHVQARRGQVVFGDPAPVKTCPACLSSDIPAAASRCKYCGTDQPAMTA